MTYIYRHYTFHVWHHANQNQHSTFKKKIYCFNLDCWTRLIFPNYISKNEVYVYSLWLLDDALIHRGKIHLTNTKITNLPQMSKNWSICPGMLSVQPHGAVLENYQVKGFIKPSGWKQRRNAFSLFTNLSRTLKNLQQNVHIPPVVALSMEQGLGITIQRLDWVGSIVTLLSVIKGYKEGCLLNGIQWLLVLTTAEVGLTALCPWGPVKCQITGNLALILCWKQGRKCMFKKMRAALLYLSSLL